MFFNRLLPPRHPKSPSATIIAYLGRRPDGGAGRFGRGFVDGGGMGGRPFGLGRKLGSVDLQLLILRLLDDQPAHGYELIKALEERSQGYYVPSPGMVYPALAQLEEAGYAASAAEGQRRRYRLTEAGMTRLDGHRAAAEALLAQFHRVGARVQRLRLALETEEREDLGAEVAPELRQAWGELHTAVLPLTQSSRDEQLRVAELLRETFQRISGKDPPR